MSKRPHENGGGQPHHKKHKTYNSNDNYRHYSQSQSRQSISFTDAFQQLPPASSPLALVPPYEYQPNAPSDLPPLPEIKDPAVAAAIWRHRSAFASSRSVATSDVSYDRLEFLGDAYLELFATRIIYARFNHLTAGQMSQMRELLVKNETLAVYAKMYGFDKRVNAVDMEQMRAVAHKGNKGMNKILGDVFEAYVAAIIHADPEEGFATTERWCTALWAPKLAAAVKNDRNYANDFGSANGGDKDQRHQFDPLAKEKLQKRLAPGKHLTLDYEQYKAMEELKGDKKGQNRWYIAVSLTGFGYDKQLLGKGEGKNKVEAGNWAAVEAMYGPNKYIVDECEAKTDEIKRQRRLELEAKKTATSNADTNNVESVE